MGFFQWFLGLYMALSIPMASRANGQHRSMGSTVPSFHRCWSSRWVNSWSSARTPAMWRNAPAAVGGATQWPWTISWKAPSGVLGLRSKVGEMLRKAWWNYHDFFHLKTWRRHGWTVKKVKKGRRSGEKGWGMNDVKWWVTVRWCNRILMDIYREFMVFMDIICLPNFLKVDLVCHMFRDTQWLHRIHLKPHHGDMGDHLTLKLDRWLLTQVGNHPHIT